MGMRANPPVSRQADQERRERASKAVLLRVPLTWSWHWLTGPATVRGEAERGGDGFKLHWGVIIQPLRAVSCLRTQTLQHRTTEPKQKINNLSSWILDSAIWIK